VSKREDDESLYDMLKANDHSRITREGIVFSVVTDCGGNADQHRPLDCRFPNCGQFRASRGSAHAYGRTPVLALRQLPEPH
jgi:hypothetical protein